MAKQLKLFNVRGWGRQEYSGPNKGLYVYPRAASHIYICANSRAHAARIMIDHLPPGGNFGHAAGSASHELKVYGVEGCWGNRMKNIEPEVGIWVALGRESHPEIKCVWKESNNEDSD